ncbi:DUF3857 domain-containing protein [Mucilaginibacter agri]|uniref:DUF3857 domain-containing protein n=1 Tax=Mucilaginibacter agri TaxID=2695265 RepID=A0A965ZFU0_9SPHI|nr:DUF3857 domain-containing protein [Mucilaginibacter agri]NCD70264.1 DUF3857 domain-containing protein [Mucilaginibacter agri]
MQFNLRLILVLLCAFVLANAYAGTPVVHIEPKPLWLNAPNPYTGKIAAREVENGYFFQLNEEQIHVEKQADYRHNILEIVSEAGIQNASQISVGFDPAYEQIAFHEITVWRNNKPLSRLKPGLFKVLADEKELADFIYQGSYSAYCILDDIRKGDCIEYSYTITGRNPIFDNKFSRDLYFQGSQPIAHLYKALLVLPQRQLHFKEFNKPVKSISSIKNGLQCYEWESYQVKPEWDYNNQPGWYNAYPYVQISDYNSWQEVTDWALKINPIDTHLNGELAMRVAALKAAAGNDKEKYFNSAVRMVQDEVRYMGIEIGQYSHRANSPQRVYNQRYGDCKDKSLLLASILQAGGIDANIVLVNADIEGHIAQFIPTPNAFNHAVVTANVNGKQVWVDATISYQRGAGTNIYFPNYGKGLVVKAGSNELTSIPPSKAGKRVVTETYSIANEKGAMKLDVKSTYTLNEADDMRSQLAATGMAETEKNYLNYYKKIYPKISTKDSVTVVDNESKNELTTIEHYSLPTILKLDKETGKYNGSVYANYINDNLPSISNTARVPIAVAYPNNVYYTAQLVLPSTWNVENSHTEVDKDAFRFSADRSTNGDTLNLKYYYQARQDYIAVDKFDEYRESVKDISDNKLSFSFTYTPDVNALPFRPNYWLIGGAILLALALGAIGIKIYRTETPGIMFTYGSSFVPLGGWLWFIALGLAVTPIAVLATTINAGFFDVNKWHNFVVRGAWAYKTTIIFEMAGNIMLICYSIFCFVLLINRRDILPKFITGLYAFCILFALLDCILSSILNNAASEATVKALTRAIVGGLIWIPYFQRSTRVQETFIVPYPASNFGYETAEISENVESEVE